MTTLAAPNVVTQPRRAAPHLPSPAELPQADILIFDGHCKFCLAQVARLQRWDGRDRLAFLSLHDPEVASRWPDLTHDQLMAEMWLVTATGERYHGAGVLRYLSRRLPRLWPLAPLMHIPFSLPLWQWGYDQVAKRRYRWGKLNGGDSEQCADGACAVHFSSKPK